MDAGDGGPPHIAAGVDVNAVTASPPAVLQQTWRRHGQVAPDSDETLWVARQCIALGARRQTVAALVGLPVGSVRLLMGELRVRNPSGRFPTLDLWLDRLTVIERTEGALLLTIFDSMRSAGRSRAKTLVKAFQLYRSVCAVGASISFELAYRLVDSCYRWTGQQAHTIVTPRCRICGTRYLCELHDQRGDAVLCSYCQLLARHATDSRLRALGPGEPRLLLRSDILTLIESMFGAVPAP